MPRVTNFHISGTDPENLISFYRDLFGWTFARMDTPSPTWYMKTGPDDEPGIDGLLHTRERDSAVVNTVDVQDLDALVERIEKAGGRILDRRRIPAAGTLALFEDPQGNVFQLRQPPE